MGVSGWPGINSGVDTGDDVETKLTDAFDNLDVAVDPTNVSTATDARVAVATLQRYDTGILEGGDVELNVDITKINIDATTYLIQGVYYEYAGVTAYSPDLQVGETSRYIGLDASGLVDQVAAFSDTQKQTIIPLVRIQAPQGQSGQGSDLLTPLHLHYYISEEGWRRRLWYEKCIGALYANGGKFTESSTALQVDESSGVLYNAQAHEVIIAGGANLWAVPWYHVSGTWTQGTDAVLVVDNLQFDDGTDLATIANNKWVSHTLLKSPKEDQQFFLIYAQAEYLTQAEAEAAAPEYGPFIRQAVTGVVAVASLVVQKSSANINSIIDRRPFVIGRD